METSELLFVVLVPHRDCLPALEASRRALFAGGAEGAFAFPAAAPLALLKRPLTAAELKAAAAGLREALGDSKISASGMIECLGWDECRGGDCVGEDCAASTEAADSTEAAAGLRFFGPALDLPRPVFPPDAVARYWEPPVLAPAILIPGESVPPGEPAPPKAAPTGLPPGEPAPSKAAPTGLPPPIVSFRAAALANCTVTPRTEQYSFSWKMGPLFWLPRFLGGRRG